MSIKSEADKDFLFRFGLIGGKKSVVEAKNYLANLEATSNMSLQQSNRELLDWAKRLLRYQEVLEDLCAAERKDSKNYHKPLDLILQEVKPQWKQSKQRISETIKQLNKISEVEKIFDLPEKVKYLVNVVLFCQRILNHLYNPLYHFDDEYKEQKTKLTGSIERFSDLLLERKRLERRPQGYVPVGQQLKVIKYFVKNIEDPTFNGQEDLIEDIELRSYLKVLKVKITQSKQCEIINSESTSSKGDSYIIKNPQEFVQKVEAEKQILKRTITALEKEKLYLMEEIKNLKEIISSKESDSKIIFSSWQDSIAQADKLAKQNSQLEIEKKELKTENSKLEKEKKECSEEFDRLAKNNEQLQKVIANEKYRIGQLTKKITDFEQQGSHQLKQYNEQLTTLEKENSELRQQMQQLVISEPKEQIVTDTKQLEKLKIQYKEKEQMVQSLERERNRLEDKLTNLNKILLNSKDDDVKTQLLLKEQVKQQEAKLAESQLRWEKELQANLKEIQEYKSKLAEASEQVQSKGRQIARVSQELQEKDNQIAELKVSLLNNQGKYDEASSVIESFKEQIRAKNSQLERIPSLEADLAFKSQQNKETSLKLQSALEDLKKKEHEISHLSKTTQQEIRTLSQTIEEKTLSIRQLEASQEQYQRKNIQASRSINDLSEQIKEKDNQLENIPILEGKLQAESQKNEQNNLKISQLTKKLKKKDTELESMKIEIQGHKLSLSSLEEKLENERASHRQQLSKAEQSKASNNVNASLKDARPYYLFNNDIFSTILTEKTKLINLLEAYTKKPIAYSKLLYKFDPLNSTNVHNYIDSKQNLLCVIKTSRVILAAFYPGALVKNNQHLVEGGLLISVTNNKSYTLFNKTNNDKIYKGMSYDDYNVIFGNSEPRLRNGSREIVCNFNVNSSYFDSRGDTVNDLLREGNKRETTFQLCEFYQLTFEEENQ